MCVWSDDGKKRERNSGNRKTLFTSFPLFQGNKKSFHPCSKGEGFNPVTRSWPR